ncbi:hypothetical protein HYZ99_03275 [Candidatus Peregrinibacteria bacterium]|nr:hypothetical protein [Candidatus Peregrinibacteria bacterium]
MKKLLFVIGIRVVCTLVGLSVPVSASALTSTSFRLEETLPNDATQTTMDSTSFHLNETGLAWNQQPLTGTSFQITSTFVAGSSASSTSSVSSESSVAPSGGVHGHGTTAANAKPRTPNKDRAARPTAPARPAAPVRPSTAALLKRVLQRREQRLRTSAPTLPRSVRAPKRSLRGALRRLLPSQSARNRFPLAQRRQRPAATYERPLGHFQSRSLVGLRAALLDLQPLRTLSLPWSLFLLALLLLLLCARLLQRSEDFLARDATSHNPQKRRRAHRTSKQKRSARFSRS